jgi:hypothetical protein
MVHRRGGRPAAPSRIRIGKRCTPMLRVLIAGMPRMLEDLIAEVILADSEMVLAGNVSEHARLNNAGLNNAGLGSAVRANRADVVIIGDQDAAAAANYEALLYEHPRLRIVLMQDAARQGWLLALTPTLTPLAEISSATLLAALRAPPPSHGAA